MKAFVKLGIFTLLVALFSSFTISIVDAASYSVFERKAINIKSTSQNLSGDWYDEKGNLIFSIHNGYVNGAKIIDAYDLKYGTPNRGIITILEAKGPRSLRLAWYKSDSAVSNTNKKLNKPYLQVYDLGEPKKLLNTYYYKPYSSDNYR